MAISNPDDAYRERIRAYAEALLRLFLGRWFLGQRQRVIARLMAADAVTLSMVSSLLPQSENTLFRLALEAAIVQAATQLVSAEVARVPPAAVIFRDPRLTRAGRFVAPRPISVYEPVRELPRIEELIRARVAASARRVVRINAVTRRAIREQLRVGIERGYTREQIARGVPLDDYRGIGAVVEQTYKNRDRTIARTELAMISNRAAIQALEAKGYKRVRVYDSAECGLVGHNDPRKPAGKVYNIRAAYQWPTSHPNCIRRFVPVIANE